MRFLCAFVALALLALAQLADAWYIQIHNMTGYLVYQEFKSGCYRPPKYFEGEFNQFAYPGAMVYIYPTTDCTGYHTVASKSNIGNGGWVNVYHPVRSFKILDVNI